MKMSCKIGSTQRVVRVILGVALLVIGFFDLLHIGTPRHVLCVIGIIAAGTGLSGYCPAGCLLGKGKGNKPSFRG